MPFDPIVKRTEGSVLDKSINKKYKTTKGAPHIILKLTHNEEVIRKCEADVTSLGQRGIRALAVAKTNEKDEWEMLGLLTFLDPPRHDTKETIHRAMSYGVEVKMITGDHLLIAMETARMLDLGDKIIGRPGVIPRIRGAENLPMLDPVTKKAPPNMVEQYGDYIRHGHGFAQVFPEHKFLIVQCLREAGFKTGMTGDGVNDAPALKRADVGIAVAGATDAARAAADIVLTEEGLSTIVEGIIISRCIFQRMKNFITYRIAATLQLLVFFFFAVLTMQPEKYQKRYDFDDDGLDDAVKGGAPDWPQFFTMPVLLLMLITLLNDGTFRYEMNHCKIRRFNSIRASACLRGLHLVFMGDSLSRYFYLSLVSLIGNKYYYKSKFAQKVFKTDTSSPIINNLNIPKTILSERDYQNWDIFYKESNIQLNQCKNCNEVCDCVRDNNLKWYSDNSEHQQQSCFENRHFRYVPTGDYNDQINDIRISYIIYNMRAIPLIHIQLS
jgi:hypothetical protein